jgi:hypothetical protein
MCSCGFCCATAVLEALGLFQQGGVDFPDCLVVALAQAHGC